MNKPLFIILNLFCITSLSSCFKSADKVDFYISESFSGNVVVLYNCKNGIEPLIVDGRSQIEVPITGIVRIKKEIKYGQIDYRYFQQGRELLELKEHPSYYQNTKEEKYVGPGTVITYSGDLQKPDPKNSQSAFIFYVHKKNEIIPQNYNDHWIEDTLKLQIEINQKKY